MIANVEPGGPDPTDSDGARTTNDAAVQRVRVLTGFRKSGIIMMLALPPLVYYLWICVTFYHGDLQFPWSRTEWVAFASRVPGASVTAGLIFVLWYLLQIVLQICAPGPWVKGTPLRNGTRLSYKMNGVFAWWFTIGLAVALVATGLVPATLLADQFGPLLTISNLFAFGFSAYLFAHGRARRHGETSSGTALYDYFMGTALNPRIGRFDLKLFFEARPGLMLWVLINLSFAATQYQRHRTITTPMILVCAFQLFYVADYFHNERRILSTMDIKHENFGWMLCWGDTVWVPFTYTLQAMYLVDHLHDLPWWGTVGIVGVKALGYFIFRSVNSQKDNFRRDPGARVWGKPPQLIRTRRGTLLLTSGWWGIARHINYLGDLLMALAWCLPCLFGNVLPYFYFVYFTLLLVHRERRDDQICLAKYGDDWIAYRKKVPWRIIPGVY